MKDILNKLLENIDLLAGEITSAIAMSIIASLIYFYFSKKTKEKKENEIEITIKGGGNKIVQTIHKSENVNNAIKDAEIEISTFEDNRIKNINLNFDKTDDRKIKILFIGSQPSNLPRLQIENELSLIKEQLENSIAAYKLNIYTVLNPSPQNLMELLLRENPDIVHFSGHSSSEGIFLNNNDSGELMNWDGLKNLLEKSNVKCLILNSVHSVNQISNIPENIPYVIGMKDLIQDKDALLFSTGFYKAIGANKNYDEAFELGKTFLKMNNSRYMNSPTLIKN